MDILKKIKDTEKEALKAIQKTPLNFLNINKIVKGCFSMM